jgi:hypothetical protein
MRNDTPTATTTAKALSVSGLPRADKAATRNDGQKQYGKRQTAFPETATPHPALSRKGRGNDTTRHDNGNGNGKSFISFWIATGDKAPSQ